MVISIVEVAAVSAICMTTALAIYAISIGVWKFLPTHLLLIAVQAAVAGMMMYLKGRL